MFIIILTFLISLVLAGIAAWFSIIGLMAIFSAAAMPIAIMASALEAAKLITASWLYRNWKTSGFLLKSYFTIAVVLLMFITSMGIFGFLSKAHLEQTSPVGNNGLKIERIDQQIAREQRTIDDAELVVGQLDQAVQTLMNFDRVRGPDGAIAVRKGQAEERAQLKATIDAAQSTIDKLEDEKFELAAELKQIELEVGPIKYIAELVYDEPEKNLESAVRWVIILLVSVFDPLAVLLLIAANQSSMRYYEKKEATEKEKDNAFTKPSSDDNKEGEGNGANSSEENSHIEGMLPELFASAAVSPSVEERTEAEEPEVPVPAKKKPVRKKRVEKKEKSTQRPKRRRQTPRPVVEKNTENNKEKVEVTTKVSENKKVKSRVKKETTPEEQNSIAEETAIAKEPVAENVKTRKERPSRNYKAKLGIPPTNTSEKIAKKQSEKTQVKIKDNITDKE